MTEKEIDDLVYNAETKNEHGFTDFEIFNLICRIGGNFNVDKYNDAMMGNTCMMNDNFIINYHCDVATALKMAFNDRDMKPREFD